MRLGLALLAAAVLAVCGAAVLAACNLSAFVAAHGEELVARAERALGRPFQVRSVLPSWLPLAIEMGDVVVGEDPRFGAAPFLVAPAVRVVVRTLPLVQGRVEVARVVLDQPQVNLVRGPKGRWNIASLGIADAEQGRPGGASERRKGRRRIRVPIEWAVGVAVGEIRDGKVVVADRAQGGRQLTAQRVHLRAEDVRFGGSARLVIDAALFGASRPDTHLELRVDRLGENDFEHTPVVARAEMKEVDLSTVAFLAGLPARYEGRLSRVFADVTGTPTRFVMVLGSRSRAQPLRLGWLVVPQVATAVDMRLGYERGELEIEDASLTAGGLAVAASGTMGVRPWRAEIDVRSAAGTGVSLGLTDPALWLSDLVGRVTVDDGGLHVDSGRILLGGSPVGFTARVKSFDPPAADFRLESAAFGGALAAVAELTEGGSAKVRARASAIELAALVKRHLAVFAGRVEGSADVTLAATIPFLDAPVRGPVHGTGELSITKGRLRDLNVAELTLASVGGIRLGPRLLSARVRARYPQIFETRDTLIQSATIPFTIDGQRVGSEQMVVKTDDYEIVGSGWIDFDREVWMQGDLVLSNTLSAALLADVRAIKYLVGSEGLVSVPIRARGRLGAVRLEPDARRLRTRGLQALIGADRDRRSDQAARAGRAPQAHDDDDRLERQILERLERMFEP